MSNAVQEVQPPVLVSGPGRFNHKEAFCLLTYAVYGPSKPDEAGHSSQELKAKVRVWNSRDGKIPASFTHPADGLTYVLQKGDEVTKVDFVPPLYSFVVDDIDTTGKPAVRMADDKWLVQFKRIYSNPQETIKKLDAKLDALQKLMLRNQEHAQEDIDSRDRDIQALQTTNSKLLDKADMLETQLTMLQNQLNNMKAEAERLSFYECVVKDMVTKVNEQHAATNKGFMGGC